MRWFYEGRSRVCYNSAACADLVCKSYMNSVLHWRGSAVHLNGIKSGSENGSCAVVSSSSLTHFLLNTMFLCSSDASGVGTDAVH